ncbi:MAG: DUF4112 domain-containing protein [Kofleriaceae bacterium]
MTVTRDPEIERCRTIARWMDQYGLDPLIGLIPGVGDLIGSAFGLYIVSIAVRRGLSKAVVARMLLHLAIDLVVGVIPIVGDVADFFYKANQKNLALLEERLGEPKPDAMTQAVDWAYLLGATAAVVGLFALAIYGLVRLAHAVL